MSASIRLVSDMPYVYGWMVTYSDNNRTIVAVRRDRWMLHESFGLFVRQGRQRYIDTDRAYPSRWQCWSGC